MTLAGALNDVNTIAVSNNALVEFRDTDNLIIGEVLTGGGCGFTTATGIVSGGGDVNLRTGTSLSIEDVLNAGTGDIRIRTGTTLSQTADGDITGDDLGIIGGTTIDLCLGDANDVNTLAVNTTGVVEFHDADNLTIGTVVAGAAPASTS